jgi:PII-like signaling protein
MSVRSDEVLIRVLVGEDEELGGQMLYEAVVARALELGMAGATVLPCLEGFGPSGRVRSDLSIDAGPRHPMIIEIVDDETEIQRFLPHIDDMIDSGLVTLERVRAIRFRPPDAAASAQRDPQRPTRPR